MINLNMVKKYILGAFTFGMHEAHATLVQHE